MTASREDTVARIVDAVLGEKLDAPIDHAAIADEVRGVRPSGVQH